MPVQRSGRVQQLRHPDVIPGLHLDRAPLDPGERVLVEAFEQNLHRGTGSPPFHDGRCPMRRM
jgi:hypothetical protein